MHAQWCLLLCWHSTSSLFREYRGRGAMRNITLATGAMLKNVQCRLVFVERRWTSTSPPTLIAANNHGRHANLSDISSNIRSLAKRDWILRTRRGENNPSNAASVNHNLLLRRRFLLVLLDVGVVLSCPRGACACPSRPWAPRPPSARSGRRTRSPCSAGTTARRRCSVWPTRKSKFQAKGSSWF